MNLLEYQSKSILAEAGIKIPKGLVVDNGIEAGAAFSSLRFSEGAVKAQVPAGGRGISGGVRFVHSPEEAGVAATDLIGSRLVTPQTGPEGVVVRKVLLEEVVRAEKEYYLGIAVNRSLGLPAVVFSPEGGKAIEEIARLTPEKVYKEPVDPISGLTHSQAETIAKSSGLSWEKVLNLAETIKTLFELFLKLDALLIEINPISLAGKEFVALDAKITIDDNAIFRHPELLSLRETEEVSLERDAREAGINYVRLEGEIGSMANGAGLAMATMDMISLAGRKPANFLDIGGGAHHEQVSSALRVMFSDPNVKLVFVNIFGGIIHCDLIATEIVEAVRSMGPEIPIIVRLEGTEAEKGKSIIAESGLSITIVPDMREGMEKVREWESL